MDKTKTFLVAAAVIAAGPAMAQASTLDGPAIPAAATYAELLQPIPNAVERLKLADAEVAPQAGIIEAQYYPPPGGAYYHHHHHHHHHHHNRSWYRRNGYSWYGGAWVRRPIYHHHHHHHHNNY